MKAKAQARNRTWAFDDKQTGNLSMTNEARRVERRHATLSRDLLQKRFLVVVDFQPEIRPKENAGMAAVFEPDLFGSRHPVSSI